MTTARAVLDANVLVGLADSRDHRHAEAQELVGSLLERGIRPVLVDFLLAEAASVICRRCEERRQVPARTVLADLAGRIPPGQVVWASPEVPRLWTAVWLLMQQSDGHLNFNDALAVCLLREGVAEGIATFDDDFDGIEGVVRFCIVDPPSGT